MTFGDFRSVVWTVADSIKFPKEGGRSIQKLMTFFCPPSLVESLYFLNIQVRKNHPEMGGRSPLSSSDKPPMSLDCSSSEFLGWTTIKPKQNVFEAGVQFRCKICRCQKKNRSTNSKIVPDNNLKTNLRIKFSGCAWKSDNFTYFSFGIRFFF